MEGSEPVPNELVE